MSFRRDIADKEAQKFINNCIDFDTPRLNSEKYPDSVAVLSNKKYDFYAPYIDCEFEEAFFLIHGGAFVYGNKELDKAFGMELALKSGLPVINVNYTLMPDADLAGIVEELNEIMVEIRHEYNIEIFHTVGDSAGGYLALLMALIINNRELQKDFKIENKKCGCCQVKSAGLICGCYSVADYEFPGIYFNAPTREAYDLISMAEKYKMVPCAIITGDQDFLREDNRLLNKMCEEKGIKSFFMDALTVEEENRNMFHVFPIANPTWPEGQKAIDLVIEASRAGN